MQHCLYGFPKVNLVCFCDDKRRRCASTKLLGFPCKRCYLSVFINKYAVSIDTRPERCIGFVGSNSCSQAALPWVTAKAAHGHAQLVPTAELFTFLPDRQCPEFLARAGHGACTVSSADRCPVPLRCYRRGPLKSSIPKDCYKKQYANQVDGSV